MGGAGVAREAADGKGYVVLGGCEVDAREEGWVNGVEAGVDGALVDVVF